jgi:hypothetical protein
VTRFIIDVPLQWGNVLIILPGRIWILNGSKAKGRKIRDESR